ncbi:MAG: GldG family protein [bacterium]
MKAIIVKLSGILGIFLSVAAVVFISMFPARNILNGVLAGLALIFLLIFFVFHFEAFRAFSRKRSTQLGLNSILMVVLFVFIAVVINLMARQYYLRADLSSTSSYSLAPQTVSVVKQLTSETRITVFGQESSPTFQKAKELLEGYRYLNRNILYSVIDLDRNPLLANEYGIKSYDSVVVKGKGKPVVVQGVHEETITNAVIRATRTVRKKMYFITGHGEHDTNSNGREGMSKAVSRLRALGYEADTLSLSAARSVPDDADLLIVAGPNGQFSRDETEKINIFMTQGGKLLALFDPGYDASAIAGKYGISVKAGMVVDPASNLGGKDEKIPLVSSYPRNPVTEGFQLSSVFPGVAPLDIGGRERTVEYFKIVATSPGSRLMKGARVVDEAGSYVIAAAAGSRSGKDVLMVFGDSDFASNAFFDVAGNGNLFLNSVNWLMEQKELVSLAPRRDDFIPLYLTPGQGRAIFYLSVIGIPISVLGSGLFVWWRRRRL